VNAAESAISLVFGSGLGLVYNGSLTSKIKTTICTYYMVITYIYRYVAG
jgi:hypothetical protein